MPFLRYYVCGAKRNERGTQDMKRILVTDESLNAYGFWVKTSGIDLGDFKKNPIMLWNHNQGWRGTDDEVLPIGVWKDLSISGSEITAVPEFDNEDEFAKRIATKFDKGHLRAASIGIKILEWSDDPALLKPGQTRPTVTKCALREISVVDIPANKNAVVLYDQDGNMLNLSDTGVLQELPTLQPNTQSRNDMEELKAIAVSLGMANTATLSEVQAEIEKLKASKSEGAKLAEELKKLKEKEVDAQKAEAKSLIDKAITDNRIEAAQRASYEKLFDADFESAKTILEGIKAPQKLSEIPAGSASGADSGKITYDGKSFSELSKTAPNVLEKLKETNIELFKQLYKSEYGRDYKETER